MSIIKGYDELQDPNVSDDAKLSGLEVKDDHTLVVTLNHSDSVFPVQLAHQSFFPLPSVAYKDIKAFGKNPIGNGPYKLKSWDVSKSITVVKNPDYKGSRTVKNGGIEFRVYTDEDSAYADVLAAPGRAGRRAAVRSQDVPHRQERHRLQPGRFHVSGLRHPRTTRSFRF